jgi:thioredoxin
MKRPRGRAALTAAAVMAAVSVTTSSIAAGAPAPADPRQVTAANFADEVIAASGDLPVIVEFYAEWCGYCRKLRPVLESLAETHGTRLRFVRVDIDAEPELAARLNVVGVPVICIFNDGLPLACVEGAASHRELSEFLEGVTSSP